MNMITLEEEMKTWKGFPVMEQKIHLAMRKQNKTEPAKRFCFSEKELWKLRKKEQVMLIQKLGNTLIPKREMERVALILELQKKIMGR